MFLEWLRAGAFEEVLTLTSMAPVHYVPHRPVVKGWSTTTTVFDALAKSYISESMCIKRSKSNRKNLTALLRFKECRIGVISDIRKAFLQISLYEKDRDILRLLWIDSEGKEKVC